MSFPRSLGDSKRGSAVGLRPRKRWVVPAVVVTLMLVTVLVASASAPPDIDTFATSQTTVVATAGSPAGGTASDGGGSGGAILGKEREVYAQVQVSDPHEVSVFFNGQKMSISTGDGTTSTTTLTYDGIAGEGTGNSDADPGAVAKTGLNGVNGCSATGCDLTQGGNTNGFRFNVLSDDTFGDLTVTVWNGASADAYCTRTFANFFPGGFGGGPARDFLVEFPAILNGTCSGTVTNLFSHVGAVQFQITGIALDMSIDTIDISVFDWGDLPETVGLSLCSGSNYATTQECEGPRHVVLGNLYLGATVDPTSTQAGELDGQPSPIADGDDSHQLDDENGVAPVKAPNPGLCEYWDNGLNGGRVRITGTGTGRLVGWIDFNNDGFQNTDRVINRLVTGTGWTEGSSFNIPAGVFINCEARLYARFRLFPPDAESGLTDTLANFAWDGRNQYGRFNPPLTPPGRAGNGEVEDYYWHFGPTAVTVTGLNAMTQGDAIEITWDTVSEVNNLGFNLYRATELDGPQTKLNSTLVPAQGFGNPWHYSYEDRASLVSGQTYHYWLEDISKTGTAGMHDPVSTVYSGAPTALRLASFGGVPALSAAWPAVGVLLTALGLWAAVRRHKGQRRSV